ncbi:MAG: HAMP domain-containing histidine kinase [Chloroflexota bacterium]|nr:HAMP domain-containing histidine kinase [Chloroflexota bacterium]
MAGCAVIVALAILVLQPPTADLLKLSLYLAISGAGSLVLGHAGLALLARVGVTGLRSRLVFGQLLVVIVAFINLALTAVLMFIAGHDLILLALLLGYATTIAITFAIGLADSIASGVDGVTRAAKLMTAGQLDARAPVAGPGEIARLATAFNDMATRLKEAGDRKAEAEAARRALIAAVSHDLRTPLSTMRVMVEAMVDGVVADDETIVRYHRTIQAEIARLSGLIDDLFQLSQIDAGELQLRLENGSLDDLISDTLRGFQAHALQAGVELVGTIGDDLPPVRLDAARVQRVIDNVVGNALRHTPAGGTVSIQAEARADGIEVSIRDSGEGMDAPELAHAVEPFFRGEQSRRRVGAGAGLGLAIARGIVEAHGGRIWAESAPREGTAIHFIIPRAAR